MVQWSSCAVLRHTRWVACPWVCDRPSACRQTANSQSTPEQNLLPKGIVNRRILDSENFRVLRLSSIKVTSRFSPHLFYKSQTKVEARKQDCRLNPRMKLGTRELQQNYPTPRKLSNLNPHPLCKHRSRAARLPIVDYSGSEKGREVAAGPPTASSTGSRQHGRLSVGAFLHDYRHVP